MDKRYKLQSWDYESGIVTVMMTYEGIIANPFGLNAIDIAAALLDKLRADRGLEPLDPKTFDRKWSKIDLSLPESRYETAKRTKIEVMDLKNRDLTQREIAKKLNLSEGCISKILSRRR